MLQNVALQKNRRTAAKSRSGAKKAPGRLATPGREVVLLRALGRTRAGASVSLEANRSSDRRSRQINVLSIVVSAKASSAFADHAPGAHSGRSSAVALKECRVSRVCVR